MNRITRALVALSILLSVPGLAPYEAAAQALSAGRAAVPVAPVGAAGAASINALSIGGAALPAPSLQAGLVPSLAPSAALTPVAVAAPVLSAPALAAPAAVALAPVALKAALVPAASAPEKRAATVAAVAALETAATALSAAAKSGSQDAPKAALDGMFENSAARADALAVSAKSAPSDSPRLDAPGQRGPPKGPRWVKNFAPGSEPRTSLKRTMAVGFLGAVVPITITMVAIAVAQILGYELHPNYQGPGSDGVMSLLHAVLIWIGAAIMAPISEEAVFRGGMQGKLAKLTAKLRLGSFFVPAAITSVIFVALHETADPLLFSTRFVHAMILGYIYKKEGILAAMAAHGFFNGLLALALVLNAAGLSVIGFTVMPAAAVFAWRAAKYLRKQKPDIASGALAPKPLTPALAVLMAGLLMAGYFFLMPNIMWALGAAALLFYAVTKKG